MGKTHYVEIVPIFQFYYFLLCLLNSTGSNLKARWCKMGMTHGWAFVGSHVSDVQRSVADPVISSHISGLGIIFFFFFCLLPLSTWGLIFVNSLCVYRPTAGDKRCCQQPPELRTGLMEKFWSFISITIGGRLMQNPLLLVFWSSKVADNGTYSICS